MGLNETMNVEELGERGWEEVQNPQKVTRQLSANSHKAVWESAERKADE